MRMSMRRFTRLTNAFSKKFDNHVHARSLYAGVTDRLWSLEDVIERIDADAPAPKSRGPYKKREALAWPGRKTRSIPSTRMRC